MATPIRVEAFRSGGSLATDLRTARVLAHLMDSQFEIAGVKFGLDAVVGLVPVLGDLAGLVVSLYPLHLVRKHHLGKTVLIKMVSNIVIDFSAGLVPVIGDAADVLFRANLKNLALLEAAASKRGVHPAK